MGLKKRYLAIIPILGIISIVYINNPKISMTNSDDLIVRTNESGQTYGSNLAIESHSMDENGNPNDLDLILVEADNGKTGYAYKEDFYDISNQPKNPEEAVEYMKNFEKYNNRVIPVYEKDGKTVIGSYKIGSK